MKNAFKGIKNMKKDFFVLKKNKVLMADKIMDYSPSLKVGILRYKNVCLKFFVTVVMGILINKYIIISAMCFIAAIYFIILMLKYTKYGMINKIINKLADDITFKGIYDKEKIDYMIYNYKKQFGAECSQYGDLCHIITKYEKFVLKLEYIIKDLEIESMRKLKEDTLLKKYAPEKLNKENKDKDNINVEEINNMIVNTVECKSSENGIIYSGEDGMLKEAKKVVDFFNEGGNNNTVVLKNKNDKKNLTIFLYKRSGDLQNNAL